MSITQFLLCFYIAFVLLLGGSIFGNLLYCRDCPYSDGMTHTKLPHCSVCKRFFGVDQFHKIILQNIPGFYTALRLHHVKVIIDFVVLFRVVDPTTVDMIVLISVLIVASLIISATYIMVNSVLVISFLMGNALARNIITALVLLGVIIRLLHN
jgi:hypothetical protein